MFSEYSACKRGQGEGAWSRWERTGGLGRESIGDF